MLTIIPYRLFNKSMTERIMNSIATKQQKEHIIQRDDFFMEKGEHCATDNGLMGSMLALDQILAFMPRRYPHGALDVHLLLYPLNVLRLTEAMVQAMMLFSEDDNAPVQDECKTWSVGFAVPCSLAKTQSGACRVRVAWKILAAPGSSALNRSSLIRQWAEVIRQLQRGHSCPQLGLNRATGAGIRLSASLVVNKLIQELPDFLDKLTVMPDVANNLQALSAQIKLALQDAVCAPLYEELSEFEFV